jgi:predicted RNase H-like HicB family nuclease
MDPRVQSYLNRDYSAGLMGEVGVDGRAVYAAWLHDLPGCIAQGDSAQEALERLAAVMPAYFDSLLRRGVEIPDPSTGPAIKAVFGFYDQKTGGTLPLGPFPKRPGLRVPVEEFRIVEREESFEGSALG